MSLRKKSLILVGLTLMGLLIALSLVARVLVLNSMARLEEREVQRDVARVVNALLDDVAELHTTARDEADNDLLAAAMIANNAELYAQRAFDDQTFITNKFNVVLLATTSGKVVFGKAFDLNAKKAAPLPARLQTFTNTNDVLLRPSTAITTVAGLLLLPAGPPLLVAALPIVGPRANVTRGTLILGRTLTPTATKQLSELTRLAVTLYRLDDTLTPAAENARKALSDDHRLYVQPTNDRTISGFTLLNDVYGQPALIVQVTSSREIYQQGQLDVLYLIVALIVTGLVFGVVVYVLMERLVLSRVASLSQEMTQIGAQQNFAGRVTARGKDELGQLATTANTMLGALEKSEHELAVERDRAERLLLNILPKPIAERLKISTDIIAESFPAVTVLFADLVGFTPLSATMKPEETVALLNQIFSSFDRLAEKHGLEKIKTIGDAYMVVGGLPDEHPSHAAAIADMALDMHLVLAELNAQQGTQLKVRIGINTGPVVAGVIGTKKFIYDLWGDAVNTASRMESQGIAGDIQVTASTHEILRNTYVFEDRGIIEVKGKGPMQAYLLKGKR